MIFSHLFSPDTLLVVYLIIGGLMWLLTLEKGWNTGDAVYFLLALFFGWIVGLFWLPIVIFALVIEGTQWLMDNAPRFRSRDLDYDAEIKRLMDMDVAAMDAELRAMLRAAHSR